MGNWLMATVAIMLTCALCIVVTLATFIVVALGELMFPYGGMVTLFATVGTIGFFTRHRMEKDAV